MKCPHCGAKNPDNGVFCIQCEKWILAEVYTPTPVTAEVVSEPETTHDQKKWSKRKVLISTVATLCVFALCVGLLLPGFRSDDPTQPQLQVTTPPFTTPSAIRDPIIPITSLPIIPDQNDQWVMQAYGSMAVENGDSLAFIQNKTFLATDFRIGDDQGQTSLDGKTLAILTNDNQLIYVRDGSYTLVDEHVTSYTLSAEGTALVYTTKRDLRLYHADGRYMHVATIDPSRPLTQFVVTPDGRTVYYTAVDAFEESEIILYRWHISEPNVSHGFAHKFSTYTLLSASNSGDLVYAYDSNTLYGFHADRSKETVGIFDIQYAVSAQIPTASFLFSADHNQVLFYHKGKTCISIGGKPAIEVKEGRLKLIRPEGTVQRRDSSLVSTAPCRDLRNQLYQQDYVNSLINVYFLYEDLTTHHLIGMTQQVWLAPDGPIYFLTQQNQIMRAPSANQINQLQLIMEDVGDNIAVDVMSDTVYMHQDGSLYTATLQEDGSVSMIVVPWPDDTNGTLIVAEHKTPCLLTAGYFSWYHNSYINHIETTDQKSFACGQIYLLDSFGRWLYLSNEMLIPLFEIIYSTPANYA